MLATFTVLYKSPPKGTKFKMAETTISRARQVIIAAKA
jgi:hypothetical protein